MTQARENGPGEFQVGRERFELATNGDITRKPPIFFFRVERLRLVRVPSYRLNQTGTFAKTIP
jgi:hypothetical protein